MAAARRQRHAVGDVQRAEGITQHCASSFTSCKRKQLLHQALKSSLFWGGTHYGCLRVQKAGREERQAQLQRHREPNSSQDPGGTAPTDTERAFAPGIARVPRGARGAGVVRPAHCCEPWAHHLASCELRMYRVIPEQPRQALSLLPPPKAESHCRERGHQPHMPQNGSAEEQEPGGDSLSWGANGRLRAVSVPWLLWGFPRPSAALPGRQIVRPSVGLTQGTCSSVLSSSQALSGERQHALPPSPPAAQTLSEVSKATGLHVLDTAGDRLPRRSV